MGLRSRAADAYAQIRRGFFRRMIRVLFIVAVEPVIMWLAYAACRLERRVPHLLMWFRLGRELRRWKARKREILAASERLPKTSPADLGLEPDQLRRLQGRLRRGEEVVIAEIDQDYFFLSHFGPIPELPTIEKDDFVPRRKYRVQLVAKGNWVGVKKWHRNKRMVVQRFLSEVHALHTLASAGCRVPAILDIDFDALTITTALVRGDNLRERLARESAVVRDRDVENDPAFQGLSETQEWKQRVASGASVVRRVVDDRFIDDLYRQLQIVHASRIAWNDLKYGNIIIERESGLPWLIDFDGSTDCSRMNRYSFRALCDGDVEWFNSQFNRRKWTYRRIKRHARSREKNPLKQRFYAPAYVGYGIWFGRIGRIGVGFERWNYILKDNLPPVSEKRVLVLGANNGFNAIQLARSGAREVNAVELGTDWIRQGEILRELYEWADNRPLNVRFLQADMTLLPEMELGRFDMVMALCCLYHLDAQDMRRVTRYVSSISDLFVLQGNHATGIGRDCVETYKKARIEFLEEILRANGFEDTETISYPGYARPLLIGRKAA